MHSKSLIPRPPLDFGKVTFSQPAQAIYLLESVLPPKKDRINLVICIINPLGSIVVDITYTSKDSITARIRTTLPVGDNKTTFHPLSLATILFINSWKSPFLVANRGTPKYISLIVASGAWNNYLMWNCMNWGVTFEKHNLNFAGPTLWPEACANISKLCKKTLASSMLACPINIKSSANIKLVRIGAFLANLIPLIAPLLGNSRTWTTHPFPKRINRVT
jgi:hypothetical protein